MSAFSMILPYPDIPYESLLSSEPAMPSLINYVDASIFGPIKEICFTNQCLRDALQQNPKYNSFLNHLNIEVELLSAMVQKRYEVNNKLIPLAFSNFLFGENPLETQKILSHLSPEAKKYAESKIELAKGWRSFQNAHPNFATLCRKENGDFTSLWYPFHYPLPFPKITIDSAKTPLIFLEPLEGNYRDFLKQIDNIPSIFVFETCNSLLHMLQYPELIKPLSSPQNIIYILELYPNPQFSIQNRTNAKNLQLQPIFFAKRRRIEDALPVLTEAISECISLPDNALQSDNEPGNWLYTIGKRLLLSIKEDRLGVSRAPALTEYISQKNWHDLHKGLPSKERDLGPSPDDNMAIKLSQLSESSSKPRKINKHAKQLKLVHIVSQIVDGGHAPSRLLENLILQHNPDQFEIFLVSTERMEFHLSDYPHNFHNSLSSTERAPKRLELFKSLGTHISIQSNAPSYEFSAQSLAAYLHKINADVAVFHGPDIVNCMAAQLTDVPVRVLLEHGTPAAYPGFDLAIVSSIEGAEIYKDLYDTLNTMVRPLPFQLDVKTHWQPGPYSKENWGVPPDCLIMTTVSNHLADRISNEMRNAIAEILNRIPNVYYMPLGYVSDEKKQEFINFFKEHHVAERVIFLGGVATPSQFMRSMHLYLNEFPFGSGLGILDALAAGCPIVTMHDPDGPPQARYGGYFFGTDKSIAPGNKNAYVDLACKLLANPEMYKEWSEHAKKQYEKYADVSAYVKSFEKIIKDFYYSE